ncbi:hypothetical protein AU195_08635 [Mycobacterium sp. IS-1496]|uniref:ankyrin repeat domain-containing protein n=1 Tax=Mycobacterium sp. IS-1496 TaxID=1772284 RepID=UPI0007417B6A|nr:ankyrin repeat domain-containing protein [Mycobacterium sp. IS-1496]KUI31807.1 hypothetical protein AU195_08635 [Mycobacterium sp. IS-1496]
MDEEPLDWAGVLDPSMLSEAVVAARHRLADAARAGDWSAVLHLLDSGGDHLGIKDIELNPNQWRPGSPKWFTPLHQAAWHGAPVPVVAALLERGALRSLMDAKGRTARDVAVERRHSDDVITLLTPRRSPLGEQRVALFDRYLAEVIDRRIREFGLDRDYPDRDPRKALRYPPVGVLHEAPGQSVWFPIPGMYGGFHVTLRQGYLESLSWCRVAGGSAQAHVITSQGAVLTDEEFDL